MTAKVKQARFSRAEEFLVNLAASVPRQVPVRKTEDVEVAARGIADYFVRKVAAGDLDSILEVLDETLKLDTGSRERHAKTRQAGTPRSELKSHAESHPAAGGNEVDPHFWG